MGTYLGFDYGTARIGIAVGQDLTGVANPLTTLRAIQQKPDWGKIEAVINEWQPQALVVGLPMDLDGTETEIAPQARRFSRQLEGRFHLPVHLINEALTSQAARQSLGRAVKSYEELDALAAKLILETWFSEQR